MRQRFFDEMDAVAAGRDPWGVIRNPNVAAFVELPNMTREINTEGITLEEFAKIPVLHQRLIGFRHHYGQPPRCAARSSRRWESLKSLTLDRHPSRLGARSADAGTSRAMRRAPQDDGLSLINTGSRSATPRPGTG
jgi:hypothetical protein